VLWVDQIGGISLREVLMECALPVGTICLLVCLLYKIDGCDEVCRREDRVYQPDSLFAPSTSDNIRKDHP